MSFSTVDYQNFVHGVAKKAIDSTEKLVTFGQRDEVAVAVHTIPRIVQACKNAFIQRGGSVFDPVESMLAAFSAGSPSFGDVAGLETKGIEDITIIAAIKSIVKYLSAERSMTDTSILVEYQSLGAVNTAGGFTAGQKIIQPFAPSPLVGNLKYATATLNNAAGSAVVFNFGQPIVPGTINLTLAPTVVGAGDTVLGQDPNKDGVLYFKVTDSQATHPVIPTVVVDYVAGTITVSVITALWTGSVTVTLDASADATGNSILKTKADFDKVTLSAVPNNIILEGNLEAEAYRNRMFQAMIDTGNTLQMGDISFRQLLNYYVSYINLLVAQATVDAGTLALAMNQSGTYVELDISGYNSGGYTQFAPTKDDKIQKFFLDLNSKLLTVSDHGVSAILVGIEGCNILNNVAGRFVEDPTFRSMADGFVGTFNNVPVIRHRLIDTTAVSASGYANVYFVSKDPSGKAAPTVFGEYLPMYTTKQTLNYNNPTQFAQALFSYIGVTTMVINLIAVGRIKY